MLPTFGEYISVEFIYWYGINIQPTFRENMSVGGFLWEMCWVMSEFCWKVMDVLGDEREFCNGVMNVSGHERLNSVRG